jgi:myo-inositol-1(or 4)-monophosphatase
MSDPVELRLALARAIADEGARLALHHFNARDSLIVEEKTNPQDRVSQADRAVEALLRARINAAFPDDAILGEEHGAQAGDSGFAWVLDPIDGTAPFLAGLPHWGVVIALCGGDVTLAGVIAQPMAGETFSARAGQGAWLNGARLRLGGDLRLDRCSVGIGVNHRAPRAPVVAAIELLLAAGGMFYRNGSGAVMLASVAAGRLGGYFEPHMNPWDCLAGLLLVHEAGGRTLPYVPGGLVLAAAPGVFDPLVEICLATGARAG